MSVAEVTCLIILAESAPGCGLGVRAQTEMKICVKDMQLLKVVKIGGY